MELFGYFRKKELIFWKNCTIFSKTTGKSGMFQRDILSKKSYFYAKTDDLYDCQGCGLFGNNRFQDFE